MIFIIKTKDPAAFAARPFSYGLLIRPPEKGLCQAGLLIYAARRLCRLRISGCRGCCRRGCSQHWSLLCFSPAQSFWQSPGFLSGSWSCYRRSKRQRLLSGLSYIDTFFLTGAPYVCSLVMPLYHIYENECHFYYAGRFQPGLISLRVF